MLCFGESNPHFIHRRKGSTVPYVVERIVQQGTELNKSRVFIPTGEHQFPSGFMVFILLLGFQSKQLIVDCGLRLGDVDQYPTIDVTIDGADE